MQPFRFPQLAQMQSLIPGSSGQSGRSRTHRSLATLFLSSLLCSLWMGWSQGTNAQTTTPELAPAEVMEVITQVDAAANRQDVDGVMQFFSSDFSHADGLTRDSLEEALSEFWSRHSGLNYQTVLNSWVQDGTAIVMETTTTITGTQSLSDRNLALTATIKSRQRIENQQIVHQETLSEQSRLTTGEEAPTVEVMLPEQVVIGRNFAFDAIVQEPLGESLLMGAALEEPVEVGNYLNPNIPNLELLSSGGLFKVGRAPALPDDRWISAIIVHEDGIVAETRRLRVVSR